LFTCVNIVAGVLIVRDAPNATLALVAVFSALTAPVNEVHPVRLVFAFTLPAMIVGMVSSTLYDRLRTKAPNRTSL
jgi:hypothetical protein